MCRMQHEMAKGLSLEWPHGFIDPEARGDSVFKFFDLVDEFIVHFFFRFFGFGFLYLVAIVVTSLARTESVQGFRRSLGIL